MQARLRQQRQQSRRRNEPPRPATRSFVLLLPCRRPFAAFPALPVISLSPVTSQWPWLCLLTCWLGVRHRGMASGAAATLATLQPRCAMNWAICNAQGSPEQQPDSQSRQPAGTASERREGGHRAWHTWMKEPWPTCAATAWSCTPPTFARSASWRAAPRRQSPGLRCASGSACLPWQSGGARQPSPSST